MKSLLSIAVMVGLLMIFSVFTAEARYDNDKAQIEQANADPADMVDLKCPKCQNHMEHGFLLEDQGSNVPRTDTKWVQGPVVKGRVPFSDIKTDVTRHVVTYRCTKCGFLESYAGR